MLRQFLGVRSGEERTTTWLGIHVAVFLAGSTIHSAAGEALFLQAYDAEDLPLTIVAGAIIGVGATAAYHALRERFRVLSVAIGVAILLASVLIVLCTLYLSGYRWPAFALTSLLPVHGSLLGFELGRLRALSLDSRSARRLLPLLGAIGGLGATIGAFLVTRIGNTAGPVHVIWIAAVLTGLTIIPSLAIQPPKSRPGRDAKASWKRTFSDRYALLLVALGLLAVVLQVVVRVQLGGAVKDSLPQSDFAEFYGRLALWLNAASIGFALLISRLAIARLGVGRSLLLYPVAMVAAAVLTITTPVLAAVAAGYFCERLIRQNIQRPVASVATMPLVLGVRTRLALAQRGVLIPAVKTITALLLLLSITWSTLSWVLLVLAVLALIVAVLIRLRYAGELASALRSRRLRSPDSDAEGLGLDREARRQLSAHLRSEFPERVSLALQLLAGNTSNSTVTIAREQWLGWEPWLRVEAVRALSLRSPRAAPAFLQERFDDGGETAEVKAALLNGCRIRCSVEELAALLESADPDLCAAASSQLVAADQGAVVEKTLDEWIASEREELQLAAARVAGTLGGGVLERYRDVVHRHPLEALEAYRRESETAPVSYCIAHLWHDDSYAIARDTLIAIGERAIPDLIAAARAPTTSASSLSVLADIELPSCRRSLLELLESEDRELRYRVARSLARQDVRVDGEDVLVRGALEIDLALCERYDALRGNAESPILDREATAELDWAIERTLVLLSVLDPDGPFRKAYLSLTSSDARERGFAIELLDEVVNDDVKRRLLPILEASPTSPDDSPGHGADESSEHDTGWLDRVARALELPDSDPEIQRAIELQRVAVFQSWRLRDLVDLAGYASTDTAEREDVLWLRIRDGRAVDLERTLLYGESARREPGDVSLPLHLVYETIQLHPRCAKHWLKGLAMRLEDSQDAEADVTRTHMLSLASRTLAKDHDQAEDDFDVWRRMFYLRTMPLTHGLSSERLRLLAEIARPVNAAAGETVLNEGRLGNHFYLVCTGRLRVDLAGETIAELQTSEGFGALSLLTGRRRGGTVKAIERSELLVVDRVDFLDLLDAHPTLVHAFSRMVAERVLHTVGL